MSEIGDVTASLKLDFANFVAGLQAAAAQMAAVQGQSAALGSAIGSIESKIMGLAATVGITVGIAATFHTVLEATEDLERGTVLLDTVYSHAARTVGVTRQELDDMTETLRETTSFTDDASRSAETMMLKFHSVRGDIFKEAMGAAADFATVMGRDLSGAAQMLGRSLENPAQGFMMLRRAGVIFTDSEKETIKVLANTGQIAEAQALILKKLENAVGGAAVAYRNTLPGAIDAAKAAADEFYESIGKELSPVLKEVVNSVTEWLNANHDLATSLGHDIADALRDVVAVMKFVIQHASDLKIVIEALVALKLGTWIAEAVAGFKSLNALISISGGPLGMLIAGIIALGAMTKGAIDAWRAESDAVEASVVAHQALSGVLAQVNAAVATGTGQNEAYAAATKEYNALVAERKTLETQEAEAAKNVAIARETLNTNKKIGQATDADDGALKSYVATWQNLSNRLQQNKRDTDALSNATMGLGVAIKGANSGIVEETKAQADFRVAQTALIESSHRSAEAKLAEANASDLGEEAVRKLSLAERLHQIVVDEVAKADAAGLVAKRAATETQDQYNARVIAGLPALRANIAALQEDARIEDDAASIKVSHATAAKALAEALADGIPLIVQQAEAAALLNGATLEQAADTAAVTQIWAEYDAAMEKIAKQTGADADAQRAIIKAHRDAQLALHSEKIETDNLRNARRQLDEFEQGAENQAAKNKDAAAYDEILKKWGSDYADLLKSVGLLSKAQDDQRIHLEAVKQAGVGASQAEIAAKEAELHIQQEFLYSLDEEEVKRQLALKSWQDFYKNIASTLDVISQSMGGTNTWAGNFVADLSKLATALDQVRNSANGMAKAMAAAAAINIGASLLKDLGIGAAGKTGGQSSFGGALEGNYAGVGSMVGTVIGAIVGAIVTWASGGAGAGPGSAIGGAIGGVLGALISKAGDSASASLMSAGNVVVGETSSKLNGAVYDTLMGIFKGVNTALGQLGLQLQGLPLIDVKIRDNIVRVVVGSVVRTFSSMQDAISFGITEALKQATASAKGFVPPELLAALKNTKAEDLQSLQSDIDFAMKIANYNIPQIAQDLSKNVNQFFIDMKRAADLGIDTSKVAAMFVDDMKRQRDDLLGITKNLSPQDKLKQDVAAYNQRVQLIRAQTLADEAKTKMDIANLQAEIAVMQGHAVVQQTRLGIDIEIDKASSASLAYLQAALAAANAAIIADEAVLANLIEITDKELADALKRLHTGAGKGGAGQSMKDWLEQTIRDFNDSLKGPFQKAMDDLKKKFADQGKATTDANIQIQSHIDHLRQQAAQHGLTKKQVAALNAEIEREEEKLRKNNAALAALNAERDREAAILRQQQRDQFRSDLHSYLSGDPLGIQGLLDQAKKLGDEARDAFAAGSIGATELNNALAGIQQRVQQLQFQALSDAANNMLLGLYQYLGMDKEASALKHQMAVSELLLKQAELQAALTSSTITDEMRAQIEQTLGLISPLIKRVINDPNYGVLSSVRDLSGGIQQAANTTANALQTLIDALASARKNIQQLIDDTMRGANGIVTPRAALEAAQAQYDAMLKAAKGGDITALQNAPTVAKNLIDVMKQFSPELAGVELPQIMQDMQDLLKVQTVHDPQSNLTYTERFVAQQQQTNSTLNTGFADLSSIGNQQLAQQSRTQTTLDQMSQTMRQIRDAQAVPPSSGPGDHREPIAK